MSLSISSSVSPDRGVRSIGWSGSVVHTGGAGRRKKREEAGTKERREGGREGRREGGRKRGKERGRGGEGEERGRDYNYTGMKFACVASTTDIQSTHKIPFWG